MELSSSIKTEMMDCIILNRNSGGTSRKVKIN